MAVVVVKPSEEGLYTNCINIMYNLIILMYKNFQKAKATSGKSISHYHLYTVSYLFIMKSQIAFRK